MSTTAAKRVLDALNTVLDHLRQGRRVPLRHAHALLCALVAAERDLARQAWMVPAPLSEAEAVALAAALEQCDAARCEYGRRLGVWTVDIPKGDSL